MSALCRRAHDVEQSPVHLEHGIVDGWRAHFVRELRVGLRDLREGSTAEAVNVLSN